MYFFKNKKMLFNKKSTVIDIWQFFILYQNFKKEFAGIVCFAVLSIFVFQLIFSSSRLELVGWIFFNTVKIVRITFNYAYLSKYRDLSSAFFNFCKPNYISYRTNELFRIYWFSVGELITTLKQFDELLENKKQQFKLHPTPTILLSSTEEKILLKTSELVQKFKNHWFYLTLRFVRDIFYGIVFVLPFFVSAVPLIRSALTSGLVFNSNGFISSNQNEMTLECVYLMVKFGTVVFFYHQVEFNLLNYSKITLKRSTQISIFWSDIAEESLISIVEECVFVELL